MDANSSALSSMHSLHASPFVNAVAAALVLGSLGGCANSPASLRGTSTVTIPSAWQQEKPTAVPVPSDLARWWAQFNDPVLNEVVASALRTSVDVRTALSRISESRARYRLDRADYFPMLSASASGQSNRAENRQTDIVSTDRRFSAGLDASWEIDLFGRQRALVRAAAADLAQTEANYHAAQVSLIAEVATAYVSLRSATAQIAVVERSLATRQETVQLTRWREQAGLVSALDTQQSVSLLEQARASLPPLYQAAEQTRNQLALLSGLLPGALDTLLAAERPVPIAMENIAIGIPADTLRQRPDIRAAEAALEAATARTLASQRRRFPSLSLSGTLGVEASRFGDLTSPTTAVANAVGSLTAPIFDAGRIRQSIRIQTALEEQAFIGYEASVLTALSEVENALIAERRTQERLGVLVHAITAAESAATLAQQQYEAGSVDLITVLDAQRTLLSLQQQQVTTKADRAAASIQLYKALGGGWASL